jgi:hypothetical protein
MGLLVRHETIYIEILDTYLKMSEKISKLWMVSFPTEVSRE